MAKYRLYQVDAFTKEKLAGNPAGIITNADGLDDIQMQRIARELNNPETAFLFSPKQPGYDVHVRFFTPLMEVPICGHATIAAHYARATELNLGDVLVLQKTGAGILPVNISRDDNDYRIEMTQGEISFGCTLDGQMLTRLLAALGISVSDLNGAPVQQVSTGYGKMMVGIRDADLLNALRPDMPALVGISEAIGCNGYYVYVLDSSGIGPLVQGRMFAPAAGVNEDPVTGNANGPLGAYLVRYGLVPHDGRCLEFSAVQGEAMGRRGIIDVSVDIENGQPVQVRVAGFAVIAFQAELEL